MAAVLAIDLGEHHILEGLHHAVDADAIGDEVGRVVAKDHAFA